MNAPISHYQRDKWQKSKEVSCAIVTAVDIVQFPYKKLPGFEGAGSGT
jgi:hypothetical protein